MGRALSDLRAGCRRLILETDENNTHFDNTVLNAWINDWLRDLAVLIEWPKFEATETSVASQATYTLPTDFLSMIQLLFNQDGNGERQLFKAPTLDDIVALYGGDWKNQAAGSPAHYYFPDTNVLGLHPKPDSNNASRTIRIFYVGVPTALSAETDEPDVPVPYHDSCEWFVTAKAHAALKDLAGHDKLMQRYRAEVASKKSQLVKMSQEAVGFRWMESEDS